MPWRIFGWNIIAARPFWPLRGCWLGLCPQSDIVEKRLLIYRQVVAIMMVLQNIAILVGLTPLVFDFRFSYTQKVFDFVYVLILALWVMLSVVVILIKDTALSRTLMYACFALFACCRFASILSSYGFLPCGVMAGLPAPLSVGLAALQLAIQPVAQAIVFGQISFPLFAIHVLTNSLAFLGTLLAHAHWEITDCSAPRSNPLMHQATPERCTLVMSNIAGLAGVYIMSAKLRMWRSDQSKRRQVTSLETLATNDAITSASRFDQVVKIGKRSDCEEIPETGQLAKVVPGVCEYFSVGSDLGHHDEGNFESLNEAMEHQLLHPEATVAMTDPQVSLAPGSVPPGRGVDGGTSEAEDAQRRGVHGTSDGEEEPDSQREAQTQLEVVEETDLKGSQITQGEVAPDRLHDSSQAPGLEDAWKERHWHDPEQWGRISPAAHSGGDPLGGGAAEQSARIVEPVDVRVHVVHGLTGKAIADLKAVDVENLKNAISHITGVCPHQQILVVEGLEAREYPLWDTEVLADVCADACAQGDDLLSITIKMVVDSDKHARGPFACGQESSWGDWDGMSNCSGPLSGFDGKWRSNHIDDWMTVYHDFQHRWDYLEITGTQALDAFGNHYEFRFRGGVVFTIHEVARKWWMQDSNLCARDRFSNYVQTYSRAATRWPQRVTSPTRMQYALEYVETDRQSEPDNDDR